MKKVIFICSIALIGCTANVERRTQVLDSLKGVYAGKEIDIEFNNNQAGVNPVTDQYAYTDKNKSDIAFKIESYRKFRVDGEEYVPFIPTDKEPTEKWNEMVLIESTENNMTPIKGYVSYKFIKQFREVGFYDTTAK